MTGRWMMLVAVLGVAIAGCRTGTEMTAEQAGPVTIPGATVTKLADGFGFTEGPAPDKAGNVYFTDIPNDRIHKWSLDGKLSVYKIKTGGANGLFFDRNGNLLACAGGNRMLILYPPNEGTTRVLADEFEGKKFNSPNDLWIDPKGGVYFTDPRYGNRDTMEMGEHVYYLPPNGTGLIRVIDDMTRPNGVIGTPDGKTLYVADQGEGKVYKYRIKSNGTLSNKALFVESGCDGMTMDERENVYITADAVLVYSPAGELVERIDVPERPANVCFGGSDRRMLFITARTGFYAIAMRVKG
ncbi:MAG: SMP-30/gluconolactonase/LRE family protein, partial [Sedimentisphaerales bacterium]|nr:SMP-30/gluconolactonase/LRE family protein [Sedimentisphaerales bacterium]